MMVSNLRMEAAKIAQQDRVAQAQSEWTYRSVQAKRSSVLKAVRLSIRKALFGLGSVLELFNPLRAAREH